MLRVERAPTTRYLKQAAAIWVGDWMTGSTGPDDSLIHCCLVVVVGGGVDEADPTCRFRRRPVYTLLSDCQLSKIASAVSRLSIRKYLGTQVHVNQSRGFPPTLPHEGPPLSIFDISQTTIDNDTRLQITYLRLISHTQVLALTPVGLWYVGLTRITKPPSAGAFGRLPCGLSRIRLRITPASSQDAPFAASIRAAVASLSFGVFDKGSRGPALPSLNGDISLSLDKQEHAQDSRNIEHLKLLGLASLHISPQPRCHHHISTRTCNKPAGTSTTTTIARGPAPRWSP